MRKLLNTGKAKETGIPLDGMYGAKDGGDLFRVARIGVVRFQRRQKVLQQFQRLVDESRSSSSEISSVVSAMISW